jgi:hypothetical protein
VTQNPSHLALHFDDLATLPSDTSLENCALNSPTKAPLFTMELDAKARYALISENLAEVLNPEIIESILAEGRNPRVYWGKSTLP